MCTLRMFMVMLLISGLCPWRAVAAPVQETLAPAWNPAAWEREVELYCLRHAYPGTGMTEERDAQGRSWLIVRGAPILLENPAASTLFSSAGEPSLRETLRQPYPLDPLRPPTPDGAHPGRMRNYALLHTLYGQDSAAVRAQLVSVSVLGRQVRVSSSFGMADALRRIAQELLLLSALRPDLRSYILPVGGFNWRHVAGETYLSPHSFGIAVDLNPAKGPYWRWNKIRQHPAQITYPTELVRIFENNGFVWGGKWHEYDLMHFEYRPEILCKARLMGGKLQN